jgi:hypothetical protein
MAAPAWNVAGSVRALVQVPCRTELTPGVPETFVNRLAGRLREPAEPCDRWGGLSVRSEYYGSGSNVTTSGSP